MSITILYGIKGNTRDVTEICLHHLTHNNIMIIPKGDSNRCYFFGDHIYGTEKKIFIIINNNEFEYNHFHVVKVNIINFTINTVVMQDDNIVDHKINILHSKLKINYGNFTEELPEQKMSVRYLTGNEKVLELGGNIGRNSLIIASIIDNNNFVSLESDTNIAKQLEENRNLNNYTFHIENSALSKRRLIQNGWNTKPSDILEPGHVWINTINLDELKVKYNINFDTLVLDCEGAFYYILMDMPEILDNIKLIIMENDYVNMDHKYYVDSVLIKNRFYNEYSEAGGWGPGFNNFFEVWKKI